MMVSLQNESEKSKKIKMEIDNIKYTAMISIIHKYVEK